MTEPNNTAPQPAPMQAVPPLRKPWEVGGKERRLLPLALALSYFCICLLLDWADLMADTWLRLPGLGITALTAVWYTVLFLYRGTAGMEKRSNQLLSGAVALLALTFTLFSNQWFRFWNCGALILLAAVHTWELCGGARLPWDSAGMLFERLGLLIRGPFVRCGALLDTVKGIKRLRDPARSLPALIGVAVTLPVLWVVSLVLMDADAVFAMVAGSTISKLNERFGQIFARLVLALCAAPFVFSLLYFAAHTEQKKQESKTRTEWESLPAVMLLGALDVLYLFFLGVQSAALFGDRKYLVQAGISFAEYARSGFFQLVGLAGVNVALILAALWLCRGDRRLRVLATVLVGLTAVLLVSAAWRMTLYVSAYGLSFKRLLTYWGMGMLAVLLALTVLKIWRRDFRFFRAAAPIALAGWLALNYCSIDAVAARYNCAQVEAGRLPRGTVESMLSGGAFGYDGLRWCEGDTADWWRRNAALDCENWTSWSVSAWLASRG